MPETIDSSTRSGAEDSATEADPHVSARIKGRVITSEDSDSEAGHAQFPYSVVISSSGTVVIVREVVTR